MTKEAKNRAICKEIQELTALVNAKKKRLEELKAYIRVETGEQNTDFGTWVVTYSDRKTPAMDAKRVMVERPDIFEEYGRFTESKVMKVEAKK